MCVYVYASWLVTARLPPARGCACVLESVRKLNFDFALMLRYGILGRSNQLMSRGGAGWQAGGTKGI